jgi:peptide/nickel transport system ATP-binding protein
MLEAHGGGGTEERRERVRELLAEVRLPVEDELLRRFPHQLSGGQQQRVGLAMAFACRPKVIVLDEPTTGLDVTTQAHVLGTVRDLCATHGVAALYVSHDLAVVAELTARIAVMYAGRVVEVGPTPTLFRTSAHPYVRLLVRAIPEMNGRYALKGVPGAAPTPGNRPQGCFFAPRCPEAVETCLGVFPPAVAVSPDHLARCYRHADVFAKAADDRPGAPPLLELERDRALIAASGIDAWYGDRQVLSGVSLGVRPGECVALVGESGSGKTTFARILAGLHRHYTGTVELDGERLGAGARSRDRDARRAIQYVFQSPYSSLNPRKTVGQIVGLPLKVFFGLGGREAERRVRESLERVSLSGSAMEKYPDQLSGGERQRVAIARALAVEPRLLICDEITSALDVSVQAAIVDLLGALQSELGLALLFVTHNLPLIRTIAHDVAVVDGGRIVEHGSVEQVFREPRAEATRALLEDTPSLETGLARSVA